MEAFMSTHESPNGAHSGAFFLRVGAIVLAIWAIALIPYLYTFGLTASDANDKWGQFGDYIGGLLNPVLGTLTLFGVLYTVLLQRDVLAVSQRQLTEAMRTERNMRLLSEQSSFESAFFSLSESVSSNAERVRLRVATSEHPSPPHLEYKGQEAFAALIRHFKATYVHPFDAGNYPNEDRATHLRRSAAHLFLERDNEVGPYLRSLADVFTYVHNYQRRVSHSARFGETPLEWHGPSIQHPALYAKIAANNRSRIELKVFAMYVGSGSAGKELPTILQQYGVLVDMVGADWWGREAFVADAPLTS